MAWTYSYHELGLDLVIIWNEAHWHNWEEQAGGGNSAHGWVQWE